METEDLLRSALNDYDLSLGLLRHVGIFLLGVGAVLGSLGRLLGLSGLNRSGRLGGSLSRYSGLNRSNGLGRSFSRYSRLNRSLCDIGFGVDALGAHFLRRNLDNRLSPGYDRVCSHLGTCGQTSDGLSLGLAAASASVGLDTLMLSGRLGGNDTVIPSMVFLGRGRENGAHFTADGAVDFGATLFLAGRLNDTHLGMVTGGVYNVVLVREAVILIALVHRIAVLGASRRDNGNSEGVLGGQDLFGHGRIAVLAVQGLDAVLVMSGLGSDDTLIPDMTSTTIGVGHGMGSIALAVHQHSARLGAGSLFQAFGVLEVPVVAADSGHRNENFAVAAIIGAVHPTLALSLARGLLDDFTKTRVLMDMDLGNALGLGLVADGAGIGLDARLGGSRLLGDNALVPLMLLIDGDIANMLLIVAALTDLIYTASVLAGGGLRSSLNFARRRA